MTPLKTSVAQMVAEARTRIEEIDTAELLARFKDDDVVVVDIRDARERDQGFIPGSIHAPRGLVEFWVDPESPYHREVFAQEGKSYIFHCAVGWRSALTVATLQEMGFKAAHLKDGYVDWVAQGGSVEMPQKFNDTS